MNESIENLLYYVRENFFTYDWGSYGRFAILTVDELKEAKRLIDLAIQYTEERS